MLKHKFEKLLDTSDWSVIDLICVVSSLLVGLWHVTMDIVMMLWIKQSQIIEGLLVISTWLFLATYIWMHRRKRVFSDMSSTWKKCCHYLFLIVFGLVSIVRPTYWILEYVFELTAFDF